MSMYSQPKAANLAVVISGHSHNVSGTFIFLETQSTQRRLNNAESLQVIVHTMTMTIQHILNPI